MNKTYKELTEIDQMVAQLYQADATLEKSKFGYAYKRFVEKNYMPLIKEMREKLNDIRMDNALEDEKTKEVLIDSASPRGFKFSKEGLKKVVAAENKLSDEYQIKEIEITPYISAYIPEGLSDEQREMLEGCLI